MRRRTDEASSSTSPSRSHRNADRANKHDISRPRQRRARSKQLIADTDKRAPASSHGRNRHLKDRAESTRRSTASNSSQSLANSISLSDTQEGTANSRGFPLRSFLRSDSDSRLSGLHSRSTSFTSVAMAEQNPGQPLNFQVSALDKPASLKSKVQIRSKQKLDGKFHLTRLISQISMLTGLDARVISSWAKDAYSYESHVRTTCKHVSDVVDNLALLIHAHTCNSATNFQLQQLTEFMESHNVTSLDDISFRLLELETNLEQSDTRYELLQQELVSKNQEIHQLKQELRSTSDNQHSHDSGTVRTRQARDKYYFLQQWATMSRQRSTVAPAVMPTSKYPSPGAFDTSMQPSPDSNILMTLTETMAQMSIPQLEPFDGISSRTFSEFLREFNNRYGSFPDHQRITYLERCLKGKALNWFCSLDPTLTQTGTFADVISALKTAAGEDTPLAKIRLQRELFALRKTRGESLKDFIFNMEAKITKIFPQTPDDTTWLDGLKTTVLMGNLFDANLEAQLNVTLATAKPGSLYPAIGSVALSYDEAKMPRYNRSDTTHASQNFGTARGDFRQNNNRLPMPDTNTNQAPDQTHPSQTHLMQG